MQTSSVAGNSPQLDREAVMDRLTKAIPLNHCGSRAAVGDRLKEIRVLRGWSQRQLSWRGKPGFPGCSAAYISRLETGDRTPTLQQIFRFAFMFNVDPRYIARGTHAGQNCPSWVLDMLCGDNQQLRGELHRLRNWVYLAQEQS